MSTSYYDAVAGQFTSADSLLPGDGYDPWGLSRYAYVAGNPVARSDPSGHCPFCVGFLVGAAVGGLISAGSQVVSNMQQGQSFGDAVKNVDLVEVGKAALIGGLIGGTGGMAGAALGTALAGTSTAVSITGTIVGSAAIGAGEGAGAQILDNVMHGRHWSDDVGSAALFGAATGGLGGAVGAAGGRIIGRIARKVDCSFSAETPVATPEGEQAIGTLQVGDAVEAYDPETGRASTQTVEHVWIHQDHDLIDLTLHADMGEQGQAVIGDSKQREAEVASHGLRAPPQADNGVSPVSTSTSAAVDETIHTTSEHPWLTVDHGWVAAGMLRAGERVIRLDGSAATITAVRVVSGAATMYNLTVSFLHTFAVGDGQYVVHNRCGGQVTDEDLYAFGGSPNGPNPGPRGARPGTDIPVKNGMVPRQRALQPKGISTYNDPHRAPLTGHYYRLPAGTRLPRGMRYIADGEDVGGRQPWGHRTFYPTRNMPFDEFNSGFRNLPWQYGGKR